MRTGESRWQLIALAFCFRARAERRADGRALRRMRLAPSISRCISLSPKHHGTRPRYSAQSGLRAAENRRHSAGARLDRRRHWHTKEGQAFGRQ